MYKLHIHASISIIYIYIFTCVYDRKSQANSHKNKGWETFTDAVISVLNKKRKNLVFMLWGGYAHKKGAQLDSKKHLVLKSTHPSPLSANRGGFFGEKHFSKTNAYLKKNGLNEIDWCSVCR